MKQNFFFIIKIGFKKLSLLTYTVFKNIISEKTAQSDQKQQ